MSNLEKYVEHVKEYLKQNLDMTETEIIMYVYVDLANRFKFNQDFFFGGSKKKKEIYDKARNFNELNNCLKDNKIICKSAAYILEYVLKKLGIQIRTIEDKMDFRKYKHMYNIITPKDGTEEYSIDLQEDMINIHYHDFTKDFGLALNQNGKYVIGKHEQKQIHKKIGYISEDNPYTDEYIYLFKEDLDFIDGFYDKLDFVLKNIDPKEYQNIDYWERRWKHERFLKDIFPSKDLATKLNVVEFFKRDENGNKEYMNGFFVNSSKGVIVYLFSKDDCGYNSYSVQEFALKVKNEGIEYRQEVRGLKGALSRLKSIESIEK